MAKSCVHLTEGIDTSGGTSANTASISPAANSAVIIAIFAYDCASMSVSGNGLTWTAAIDGASIGAGGFGSGRLWVFVGAGASPSSGAITLTFPADSFVNWTVDNITGTVNLATPTNANVITATGTGTTLSATLGAFANAANGTWAVGIAHDAVNVTQGTGFSLVDSNVGTAMFGWTDFSEFRDSNDTSPDATIDSSVEWSFGAIEIVEAGGGGGSTPRNLLLLGVG